MRGVRRGEEKVSAAARKTKANAGRKAKAAPKFQHPKTGATWTGRGRAPTWPATVKDRSRFLIAGGAEATVATTAGVVSKTKTAVKKASKAVGATSTKGQPKGPQPAKYRDPKSGATWSGRGPAPTWLAGAKDRANFLIVGAGAAADAKPAVTKAAVKKVVGAEMPTKSAAAKNTVPAAVKKASAKSAPRKAAAVPISVTAAQSGTELTT